MNGVKRRWMGQMGGGEWGWVGPFFGCVRVGGKTFLKFLCDAKLTTPLLIF